MTETRQSSMPLLEQRCKLCDGSGNYDRDKCPNCNGSGYEPTEFGKKIRDLVIHQFSEIVERVSDGRP